MKHVEREVISAVDGERVKALFAVCSDCNNDRFLVFVVDGQDHLHLQCSRCQTSYCPAGACAAAQARAEGS